MLSTSLLAALLSLPIVSAHPRVDALPQLRRSTVPPYNGTEPNDGGYWFEELESVLQVMQTTYYNGTYWPTTLQWIGAFLDTLLASSDISFLYALEEYDGNVPGSNSSISSISGEIDYYFDQTQAYYGGEDTIQIFGAAYDDAQWVVLEWLEAIKFVNQYDAYAQSSLGQSDIAEFAHRAHIFYNIVQNQFNTSLCGGGLTWNPALAVYKNAITNELFVASSVGMYLYWPGDNNTDPYPAPNYTNVTGQTLPPLPALQQHDPLLLQNAIKEYDWFKSQPFQNEQGLIIDGFHIGDGQTTCNEPSDSLYTYNQAVILSGLRQLWEATGNTTYLTDGYEYVSIVINATGWQGPNTSTTGQWAGLGRGGILEDYCDAAANCSQDSQTFKGIYFHHLDAFCDPLPTSSPLVPGLTYTASATLAAEHASNCAGYTSWIEHNAQAALLTRNASGIIGGWWGAPYANQTQGVATSHYIVSQPPGSQDVENEPWLLLQAPWVCQGIDCNPNGQGADVIYQRMARSAPAMRKRGVNSEGLGRTVQTEGSGLGVVKAASDFNLKRPAT